MTETEKTITIMVVYPTGTASPLEVKVDRVKGIWAVHIPMTWQAKGPARVGRLGFPGRWVPFVYRDGRPVHYVLTHLPSGYRLKNSPTLEKAYELQDLVHQAFPHQYNHDDPADLKKMSALLKSNLELWGATPTPRSPPLLPRGR